MDRRGEVEQLALFDAGEPSVPIEIRIGTQRPRRSRTRAWLLLVAIEAAKTHAELRLLWDDISRERVRGTLDRPMHALLAEAWDRRTHALRAARIAAAQPANEQRKKGRR
jgi:hypothetical protein